MKAALESGANFWNGGEFYGTPEHNSLQLLNAYFTKHPEDADKVVISIKGGANPQTRAPEGSAAGVRRSVDQCLKVLDSKKKLDLFECARVDKNTPIEETIETLAEYVRAGKLGGISLSEVSADSIRRAARVHKIDAVELELSMYSTDLLDSQSQISETCAELGIPVVAYSPLGRGFLTGQIRKPEDLPKGDARRMQPRFQPENFETNLRLTDEVAKLAKTKGNTPGQIALAWVKAQGQAKGMPAYIPIPGATTRERVMENMTVVHVSNEELTELNGLVKKCVVAGGRYGGHVAALCYGDSPPMKNGV